MTQELIISLTAVSTAGAVGLAWILTTADDVYRRGLRTGIDRGNARGYREGYIAGHCDGYHQAEREAAEHLDRQINQALGIVNADQVTQMVREAEWHRDGGDGP